MPNIELMWLTGRLAPDFKTIADFRKDNGKAIRSVCRQFVVLCRNRNFTQGKVKARMQQIEQSIDRYLAAMDSADRATLEVAEAPERLVTAYKQLSMTNTI
jgi:hypothetical protein